MFDNTITWDIELQSYVYERGNILAGLGLTITGEYEVWRGDRNSKNHQWLYPTSSPAIELCAAFALWCAQGPIGDAPDGWVRSNYHPETGGHQMYRRRHWNQETHTWIETVRA